MEKAGPQTAVGRLVGGAESCRDAVVASETAVGMSQVRIGIDGDLVAAMPRSGRASIFQKTLNWNPIFCFNSPQRRAQHSIRRESRPASVDQ